MTAALVSVVVPVFNSEECLEELVRRLSDERARSQRKHEILLVNDGSRDRSWDVIRSLHQRFPDVKGINFRRNFGQDNAIMAGLRHARGDVVVIMDDDLQHDPADVEKLVRKVEAGADVCYARFMRLRQAWWKNAGSWLNDRLATVVIQKPKGLYLSPFKAVSRDVVREVIAYDGPYPYVDGLLLRLTRNVAEVEAEHHPRFAGAGSYSLRRSVSVWLKVLTSFSAAPLRLVTYAGFAFSLVGLGLAAAFAAKRLLNPLVPLGWASTIVAVLVLGGIQLGCLGLLGEYVGRTFLHLNRQPQYSVSEVLGNPSTCIRPSRDHEPRAAEGK